MICTMLYNYNRHVMLGIGLQLASRPGTLQRAHGARQKEAGHIRHKSFQNPEQSIFDVAPGLHNQANCMILRMILHDYVFEDDGRDDNDRS